MARTDTEDMNTAPATTAPGPYTAWMAARRARAAAMPRDARGRFVRRVDIDSVEVWHIDTTGTGHAYPGCGDATAIEGTDNGPGFACTTCTFVHPSIVHHLARDTAPSHGSHVCRGCDHNLPMTKFPTVVVMGYRMRGDVCRGCEAADRKAGVRVDNYAHLAARVLSDAPDFGGQVAA